MHIATVIFTYNRSAHTEKVLSALKGNDRLPEKLFLFQDGLKNEKHRAEWEKVNKMIKAVNWCDCEVIISEVNKGLADSIVSGMDYIFGQYDAAIVLEDDCVSHPGFMTFMCQALEKYQHEKAVYAASGYAFPVDVESNGTDAYFVRRISSWGWGTWKDRWAYFERDYRVLGRILNNEELAEQFHIWGEDLESLLLGNIYGHCDSWAVFWALTVIEHKGYCLSPYRSLLRNIGFDGTGVHCGTEEIVQCIYEEDVRSFKLPEKIEVPAGCEQAFADHFSWTSAEKRLNSYQELLLKWINCLKNSKLHIVDRLRERGVKKCSIWGKGKICDLLLKELEGKVQVLSIIESHPTENIFKGIPVVDASGITDETQIVIVIPIYDFEKIKRTVGKAVRCEIVPLDYIIEYDISLRKLQKI